MKLLRGLADAPFRAMGVEMRRIWSFVLAAFVVILGLVTAGIALGSGSGGEIAKPEVIRLVTKGGQFTFLPLNTSKHSLVGDQTVISAPVFKMGTDTKIGRQHALCTLMDKKGIVGECMIKTFLHDGQIVASAVVHFGVADHTLGAQSPVAPVATETHAVRSCWSIPRPPPRDSSSESSHSREGVGPGVGRGRRPTPCCTSATGLRRLPTGARRSQPRTRRHRP